VDEHRRRTRARTNLPVSVKYAGMYEMHGNAVNIGTRGMLVELPRRLDTGTVVELVFRLPTQVIHADGVWLRGRAHVLRVEPLAAGNFGVATAIQDYEVFRQA